MRTRAPAPRTAAALLPHARAHRFALAIAVGLTAVVLAASGPASARHRPSAPPSPLQIPGAGLEPVAFADLPGWSDDAQGAAFSAFLASCRPILRGAGTSAGTRAGADDLRPMRRALVALCRRAVKARRLDDGAARKFFEKNFRPVTITPFGADAGFLTGYYEPEIPASRFPSPRFSVPMYHRPPDLVVPKTAPGEPPPNRGDVFRRTATGERVPYWDRAEIEEGALSGRHLELAWLENAADLLTVQIQGSARLRLQDGTLLRVNYDGHNGWPYTAVGRVLIERGAIPRDEMSMARIHAWMLANPEAATEVRRQNRSYVFFRVVGLDDERGPIGAQGIRLTAGRSIAVDKLLHVYGTPFFISAALPIAGPDTSDPFRRTMIAQDTGSAIVGPARADLFLGAGDAAGAIAGRLRHPGYFAMLVPRGIDPVAAGARMPLPRPRPAAKAQAGAAR
nr:MltA domain-containing protein [Rhodovulum sp. PH10]